MQYTSIIIYLLYTIASGYLNPVQAQTNTTSNKKPVYVIVHGAWGGSWAFRRTDSLLTEKGCIVYRPSLTGQGERVHLASPEINLSIHIKDVVNMILYENLQDVILVGHSYGGMVISGVADSIPERIQKLIYLDAFVPYDGESVKDFRKDDWPHYEKMVKDGFLCPDWLKNAKIPGDVPQSLKTFTEPISLKNKKAESLKGVYILTIDKGKKAEEDGFFQSSERARKKGWKVIPFEADHNPQWSATNELVKILYENK